MPGIPQEQLSLGIIAERVWDPRGTVHQEKAGELFPAGGFIVFRQDPQHVPALWSVRVRKKGRKHIFQRKAQPASLALGQEDAGEQDAPQEILPHPGVAAGKHFPGQRRGLTADLAVAVGEHVI